MPSVTTRFSDLLASLGYADSENYVTKPEALFEAAHLLRAAKEAGISGAYVFRTDGSAEAMLTPRPAVYVAEALDESDARRIHRLVWNQGAVPFLIVVLPTHVRVYTGFRYDPASKSAEIASLPVGDWPLLQEALGDYFAHEIDAGRLWKRSDALHPQDRVDWHLLRNLKELSRVLIHERQVSSGIAHGLIGKYIYIRYLRDRRILSDAWLDEHDLDIQSVLGSRATLAGLRRLVETLDERFNGEVFPLPLKGPYAPSDATIALVAQVFGGLDALAGQLALDFQIYDFSYIPVELLSCIYEQFLHVEGKGAAAGAYYTPEPVADYLLAEINSQHTLASGSRVLDPCCGSGVFLVLAYRRLIERARATSQGAEKIGPEALRKILQESVFGVERNREACYVAEFSLILTLLSYVDPPDLHQNRGFEFPKLHDKNIFECDFFAEESSFTRARLLFDWIVGNPPWLELQNTAENEPSLGWIAKESQHRPVARGRASEAFLWRVTDYLTANGTAALLVHATSLTNAQSERFRRAFFLCNSVRRITNFSNLAYDLFAGSAETPAASIIYQKSGSSRPDTIIHYGPFAANQILTRDQARAKPWALTIFEDEVKVVSTTDAASGDGRVWKFALWGSYRDGRTLERLKAQIPDTLGELGDQPGWSISLGLQLRRLGGEGEPLGEALDRIDELRGQYVLDHNVARRLKSRFSVPNAALSKLRANECYARSRGGRRGVAFLQGPHIWIDVGIAAFSETAFVLRHPLIGLSGPRREANTLRALSVYLNSSLAKYIEFFETASWGVDRRRINLDEMRRLRIPTFSEGEVRQLAELHKYLAQDEQTLQERLFELDVDVQALVDEAIFDTLGVGENDAIVISEFCKLRLQLDKGKTKVAALTAPDDGMLDDYADCLRRELDAYAEVRHTVRVQRLPRLIVCEVTIRDHDSESVQSQGLSTDDGQHVLQVWDMIRTRQSQWVYFQRGLRVFDGSRLMLCKTPRQIDWTRTQALHDADDIISEVLERVGDHPWE